MRNSQLLLHKTQIQGRPAAMLLVQPRDWTSFSSTDVKAAEQWQLLRLSELHYP